MNDFKININQEKILEEKEKNLVHAKEDLDSLILKFKMLELHTEHKIREFETDQSSTVLLQLSEKLIEIRQELKALEDEKKEAYRIEEIIAEYKRLGRKTEEEDSALTGNKQKYNTRIFTSYEGFVLFEELNNTLINCDTSKGTNQDVNFVYSQLHKKNEGVLFNEVTPREFAKWLNETYPKKYSIDKIKDGEGLTDKKLQLYSTIKNGVNSQQQ